MLAVRLDFIGSACWYEVTHQLLLTPMHLVSFKKFLMLFCSPDPREHYRRTIRLGGGLGYNLADGAMAGLWNTQYCGMAVATPPQEIQDPGLEAGDVSNFYLM